jgi:hypothetical protein
MSHKKNQYHKNQILSFDYLRRQSKKRRKQKKKLEKNLENQKPVQIQEK